MAWYPLGKYYVNHYDKSERIKKADPFDGKIRV